MRFWTRRCARSVSGSAAISLRAAMHVRQEVASQVRSCGDRQLRARGIDRLQAVLCDVEDADESFHLGVRTLHLPPHPEGTAATGRAPSPPVPLCSSPFSDRVQTMTGRGCSNTTRAVWDE